MSPDRSHERGRTVIVAARNEADRITATLEALGEAFPGAWLIVADDLSTDATPRLAEELGATVACRPPGEARGKGGAMTAAARLALSQENVRPAVVLCDGDLGSSAASLVALADAVDSGECDLAVGSFARREGGGFGIALGFARLAIRNLTGLELDSPISGQRAIRGELLARHLLPFAPGFGMEIGMTVDAARAGARVKEIELDLEHRASGRTASGFLHRGRQLADFARVYLSRRRVPRA
jgi:glycosyltransferase involved in cell wall biosynthesis